MTPSAPEAGITPEDDPSTAVHKIVDLFGDRLYSLAVRFCGDRDEAEDLVQDVFLSAHRAWEGFRGDSDVRTWLYTIASRACARRKRTRSGEPESIASLDASSLFAAPVRSSAAAAPQSQLDEQVRREAVERIETAIAELPEDFRVPLILKEIVGMTVPEVARVLGLEEGTARSRVHRARLKLREAVETVLPGDNDSQDPPLYDMQICHDLLEAKQSALDRGEPFEHEVICQRCRRVFGTLEMAHELCTSLARDEMPAEVKSRVLEALDER